MARDRQATFGAALALIVSVAGAVSAEPPKASATGLPDWWKAHVAFMTEKGGTWLAPNPPGERDVMVPDAFGMEWRAANEGHLLIGRLYGMEADGEIAGYWTFREFIHPGERRVILEQWGGPGVYGVGETTSPSKDHGQVDQTFWLPDGRSWREGHRTEEKGDEYVTHVFDIGADGKWTLKNSTTWQWVKK